MIRFDCVLVVLVCLTTATAAAAAATTTTTAATTTTTTHSHTGPRLVTMATGWGGAALSRAWWTYTVGPLLGAVAGGWLYDQTLGSGRGGDAAQQSSVEAVA